MSDAVLAAWREDRAWSEIAGRGGVTVCAAKRLVAASTTPAEREARRRRLMSAAQMRYSDDDLIGMLQRCAADLGRTPGLKAFDGWKGGYTGQLLLMRFGGWADACVEAGLEPNPRRRGGERHYSDEDELAAYERIERAAGRPPTVAGWKTARRPGEPSEGTLRRRYGSWGNLQMAIADRRGESK